MVSSESICDTGSDRILGATLIAEHAGDMIGEIALAMTAGIGLAKVGSTIHPYPTQARCSGRRRMRGERRGSHRERSARSLVFPNDAVGRSQ